MSTGWSSLAAAGPTGWGSRPAAQSDEAVFNSLRPVNGMVSGEQIKPVFQQSQLPTARLAQIWSSVDQDKDGHINLPQFIMAMSLIRQAQQQNSTTTSLPASRAGFASFPAPTHPDPTSHAWPSMTAIHQSSSSGMLSQHIGVGVGVSMATMKEGWGIKVENKRRYVMQFNTLDRNKKGLLNGSEVAPLLNQSKLDNETLSSVWQLSDIDKDGHLSVDEFVIAMHLVDKVKSGLSLPRTLPPELFPGPTKYATVDRRSTKSFAAQPEKLLEKRSSVIESADWASRQSTSTDDPSLTFEDKRMKNFKAGQMELERRRRAIKEEQERVAAEKERKRREEEERRMQQEQEAEQARQAELERQRQKALEIEQERERQMRKLALQREAEQREIERKRKEEWAKKKKAELEDQRNKERSSLMLLKDHHSRLEQELAILDQRRVGTQASVERQRQACVDMSKIIRSLQLSRDIRLEELRKAQGELNNLQARVSTLHQQRGALQASLEQRPESVAYQTARQTLNDQVMGLAALMAGLRARAAHNTEEIDKLRASYREHHITHETLSITEKSDYVKIRQLRIMVDSRKRAWQESQQREQQEREQREAEERRVRLEKERREAEQRRAREQQLAEERRVREEQERIQREIVEKAKENQRLAQLKKEQEEADEVAKKKAAIESVMADLNKTSNSPPHVKKPPASVATPTSAPVAAKRAKKEQAAKDKEVIKKVQELQAMKQELKKKKEKEAASAPPKKPTPYSAHKQKNVNKPNIVNKPKEVPTSAQLLDLTSPSTTGTMVGIRQFKQDTSQILKPVRPSESSLTTPTGIDHVIVSPGYDGQPNITQLTDQQEISDESAIYAIPKPSAERIIPPESPTTPGVGSPTGERFRALYDYSAVDSEEVHLREGEIVKCDRTAEPPPGWIMVVLETGQRGWAPESYLELVDAEPLTTEPEQTQPTYTAIETPEAESSAITPASATVLYSWQGSKDNHLSINKGDKISVLQQDDKWWSGEKDGLVGWFPRTFVQLDDTESTSLPQQSSTDEPQVEETPTPESSNQVTPSGQVYEAVYDYQSEAAGDLSFSAGDVIQVTASSGEWWTGVVNGVTGNFPYNYVQPRYESAPVTPKATPTVTPQATPSHPSPNQQTEGSIASLSKPLVAKVVVDFQSQKEGQLSLSKGDLIKVSKQAANGWWEGELQARGRQRERGWFPANRVMTLGQKANSTSSITSLTNRARSPLLEVLEDKPSLGSENLVLALYRYEANSIDELSFHKGSVLTVISKDGDWWRGELNGETGLFPSNYVQPLTEQQGPSSEPTRWADSVSQDVLDAVSDKERKRQEAIFELLTSERHYTDSLKLVKEIFFDPMVDSEVLTVEELSKVVLNWDELIKCSNDLLQSFLVRLRTSGTVVKSIGDVLINQIPDLSPHVRWCSCQLTACTILQQKSSEPEFKEFEQRCMQNPRTGGLPLSSFLLKPMQRVTKYPLLIKRILEYTAEDDLDHRDLQKALESSEKLCDQVNEAVRQKENTDQLEWLQTHVQFTLDERLVFNSATNFMGSRKLLHWGKLFKIRGAKDVLLFLFNDFLLMVKPKLFFARAATPTDLEAFGKNEFIMYRQPFLLENVRAKKAPLDQYGPSVFLLTCSSEKEVPLRADNDNKRDQWLKLITRASLECVTTKKKMQREKRELRLRTMKDCVGFLKVTVVEGCDLIAKDPNGKSDPFCVLTLGGQQEQTTHTEHLSLNPKWNCLLEFFVHDINKDCLEVSVFDKDLFSPNDFLGCAKVSLKDLFRDGDSPWTKRLLLEDVSKGEIELRIELELKASDLLL